MNMDSLEALRNATGEQLDALIETRRRSQSCNRPAAIAGGLSTAPLSFAQERMWLLQQLDPESPAYHVAINLRVTGAIDDRLLRRAVEAIMERHAVLRTSLRASESGIVQTIDAAMEPPVTILDVARLPDVQARAGAECARPFDLGRGPLFRVTLLRSGSPSWLLLVFHHAISDAWSVRVFVRELAMLYQAIAARRPPVLSPLPLQYADFAVWQRCRFKDGDAARHLSYWRERLRNAPQTLDLPADFPRDPRRQLTAALAEVRLKPVLSDGLRRLARERKATLFAVLLAAYQVLLVRYTGQPGVVVGCPVAGRNWTEVEGLVGLFVNTLPIYVEFARDPWFVDVLDATQAAVAGALARQDMPFDSLVQELQSARDGVRTPLFQTVFQLAQEPAPDLHLPGIVCAPENRAPAAPKFDISVSVEVPAAGQPITAVFEYDASLHAASTIQGFARSFAVLLEGIAAHAGRRISELPLLDREQRRFLQAWSSCGARWTENACIDRQFERQAQRTPDAVAVVDGAGVCTYKALEERANRLANWLRSSGVRPGDRVAICLYRSVLLPLAVLATWKAGAVYVPLSPNEPPARWRQIVSDTGAVLTVTEAELLGAFANEGMAGLAVDDDLLSQESAERPALDPMPESLAYIIYTSGSTGTAKGVCVTHAAIAPLIEWGRRTLALEPRDRLLQHASTQFDLSVFELCVALTSGASLVMLAEEALLDPARVVDLIEAQGITVLHGVPAQFQAIVSLEKPMFGLRVACLAGEQFSSSLLRRVERLVAPDCRIFNMYGPTETGILSAVMEVDRSGAAEHRRAANVPIGTAVGSGTLHVLDANGGELPQGAAGELFVGGNCLAMGYWNRADLTAEVFLPDPFRSGVRLYRTGDRVRWRAGGYLEFLGRVDQQVKIRGCRVEPGEVEALLSRHPDVAEAAVAARGQTGDLRLIACVVPRRHTPALAAELRRMAVDALPQFMIPSSLVVLDRLPRTASGKVDRRALPADNAPAGETPRTAEEELVAGAYEAVLERAPGRYGNFFELGGHSLRATQLVARLRGAFGVELPLRAVFETPEVAALAERIVELRRRGTVRSAAPPLTPGRPHETAPLSFAQRRLWFLEQMEPGSGFYNCPLAVRLRGELDVAALERALEHLVSRHQVLRMRVETRQGEPVGIVGPSRSFRLPVETVGNEEEARTLAQDEAGRGFDLERGPLVRARLLRLELREHVLLVSLHHMVCDGWSLGVLVRELGLLYSGGQLDPVGVSYADWAQWQQSWLRTEVLQQETAFWRRQLAGAPERIEWRIGKERRPAQTYRGGSARFELGEELAAGLRALCRQQGVTLHMALLAAFATLLWRLNGERDLVVGTAVAGRSRRELEPVVGLFVNLLPLRLRVEGSESFRQLMQRVRDLALDAYAHQETPFEKLVEELAPDRTLSHNPLVQVALGVNNVPARRLVLDGLELAQVELTPERSRFDLTLWVEAGEGPLDFQYSYAVDLFDTGDIDAMHRQYAEILESAVTNPHRLVELLALASASGEPAQASRQKFGAAVPRLVEGATGK